MHNKSGETEGEIVLTSPQPMSNGLGETSTNGHATATHHYKHSHPHTPRNGHHKHKPPPLNQRIKLPPPPSATGGLMMGVTPSPTVGGDRHPLAFAKFRIGFDSMFDGPDGPGSEELDRNGSAGSGVPVPAVPKKLVNGHAHATTSGTDLRPDTLQDGSDGEPDSPDYDDELSSTSSTSSDQDDDTEPYEMCPSPTKANHKNGFNRRLLDLQRESLMSSSFDNLANLKKCAEFANLDTKKATKQQQQQQNEESATTTTTTLLGTGGGLYASSKLARSMFNLDKQREKVETDLVLEHKRPKGVSFADDCGKKLLIVRTFHEHSDEPPRYDLNLQRTLRTLRGESLEPKQPPTTWHIDFEQPISDYVSFYQKVNRVGICLENALLRNDTHKLVGTVRVKNVCFEKAVFIRCTSDSWRTHSDTKCEHQSGNECFDTFKFELELPVDDKDHERLQFCCCYQAQGREMWDNKDGNNYQLISGDLYERQQQIKHQSQSGSGYCNRDYRLPAQIAGAKQDAYKHHLTNWTEFSSWTNLETTSPYY